MELGFLGKVITRSVIEVKTGLRIGGSQAGLKIGGVDLNVITDPWGRPYIPGSSLKGKMRSLVERVEADGKPGFWNKDGGHECRTDEEYRNCPVCRVWGVLGGGNLTVPTLTRVIVCDAFLDENSITEEMQKNLELRWTEVKYETAIDRISGTAKHGSLRQAERVPAGVRFKDSEIIFNVFGEDDKDLLKQVFIAMELLENDYLGGMGSRGYGRVAFREIEVYWNRKADYENGTIDLEPGRKINDGWNTPAELVANFEELKNKLQ